MKILFILLLAFLNTLIVPLGSVYAESYPNGIEGIKCATLPPPGLYYKMSNLFITANKLIDNGGKNMPIDFKANIFASVQRVVWVTDRISLFGANFGMQILLPVFYRDLDIGAMNYSDNEPALGDLAVEPIVFAWHKQRYDLLTSVVFFLPTAHHEDPVDPGEDMFTTMFTLGGTYYFDKQKTWAASLLSRYEIHHDDYRNTRTTPGDDFHFEWSISKTIARVWDVGVVGYCQWQVTDDHGSGVTNEKDRGYAAGPEVSVFYPPWKTIFSLRSEFEFSVEGDAAGRARGSRTFLTIVKIF